MTSSRLVRVLRLSGFPILRQLRLEEALLRAHPGNWCIINDGAASPAIVLGISGKPQQLVNIQETIAAGVQVIRRFSGGGTVIVDGGSIMTSLILQGHALDPPVDLYPRPLMQWSEEFYRPVFGSLRDFSLQENDYALGRLKFGGNAQYITKGRFLHHTSFLWDFDPSRMSLLKMPQKQPAYREGRGHLDFLTSLQAEGMERAAVGDRMEEALVAAGLEVEREGDVGAVEAEVLGLKHQKSTVEVDLATYQ